MMGFEDRDYYRDDREPATGIPGFQFQRQSIITSLIVINVLIFLLDMFSPPLTQYDMLAAPPADGSIPLVNLGNGQSIPADQVKVGEQWLSYQLALKSDRWWQAWTWLTHGFAHASIHTETGVFHILGNMLTLFFLGRPVEQHLGRMPFLKFYLAAILVGGLSWLLLAKLTGTIGFCLGASGAVSAVVVYFIFLNPRAQLLLFGVLPMPAWVVGLLFLGVNLSYAFGASQIAWEAHLAGGAFGMLSYQLRWKFDSLQFPSWPRRGNLKIHRPRPVDNKLQLEADRILAKIAEQGEASLTAKERRTLKKYSQQIRQQRN